MSISGKKLARLPHVAIKRMEEIAAQNPYPDTAIRNEVANEFGLTALQVTNWFVNHRKRKLRPNGFLANDRDEHELIVEPIQAVQQASSNFNVIHQMSQAVQVAQQARFMQSVGLFLATRHALNQQILQQRQLNSPSHTHIPTPIMDRQYDNQEAHFNNSENFSNDLVVLDVFEGADSTIDTFTCIANEHNGPSSCESHSLPSAHGSGYDSVIASSKGVRCVTPPSSSIPSSSPRKDNIHQGNVFSDSHFLNLPISPTISPNRKSQHLTSRRTFLGINPIVIPTKENIRPLTSAGPKAKSVLALSRPYGSSSNSSDIFNQMDGYLKLDDKKQITNGNEDVYTENSNKVIVNEMALTPGLSSSFHNLNFGHSSICIKNKKTNIDSVSGMSAEYKLGGGNHEKVNLSSITPVNSDAYSILHQALNYQPQIALTSSDSLDPNLPLQTLKNKKSVSIINKTTDDGKINDLYSDSKRLLTTSSSSTTASTSITKAPAFPSSDHCSSSTTLTASSTPSTIETSPKTQQFFSDSFNANSPRKPSIIYNFNTGSNLWGFPHSFSSLSNANKPEITPRSNGSVHQNHDDHHQCSPLNKFNMIHNNIHHHNLLGLELVDNSTQGDEFIAPSLPSSTSMFYGMGDMNDSCNSIPPCSWLT